MPSDWRRLDLVAVSIIAAMDHAPLSSIPSTPTEVVARWEAGGQAQRAAAAIACA